jgi:hypothetical protein
VTRGGVHVDRTTHFTTPGRRQKTSTQQMTETTSIFCGVCTYTAVVLTPKMTISLIARWGISNYSSRMTAKIGSGIFKLFVEIDLG